MICLYATLYRNPALSFEAFVDHWHNIHGPLIASEPLLSRHIVKYVQRPRVDHEHGSNIECDGIAEQWFNSVDDFFAFCSEPTYVEVIHPDEKLFLDMDRVTYVLTGPHELQII